MARITLDQLTADLVHQSADIVAVVPGTAECAPIRKQMALPKMYSADTPADLTPERLEIEVPNFERSTLKAVQTRLAELGMGYGLESLD